MATPRQNDALLDGDGYGAYPPGRGEDGVSERAKEQLCQGDRSFYANAFDGTTAIGAQKGNRPLTQDFQGSMKVPWTNMRGRSRR